MDVIFLPFHGELHLLFKFFGLKSYSTQNLSTTKMLKFDAILATAARDLLKSR